LFRVAVQLAANTPAGAMRSRFYERAR